MMLRVKAMTNRFVYSAVGCHRGSFQLRCSNHTFSELCKSPGLEKQIHNKLHLKLLHFPRRFPEAKRLSSVVVGLAAASCIANTYISKSMDIVKCDGGSEDTSTHEGDGKRDGDHSLVFVWIRRLWVPLLLVMTVAMGWHYPISLSLNCLFLLWSTRPTPSSIYIWVEQKRLQAAQRMDGLGRLKSQLSNAIIMHVEVQDYGIACIARVSSLSQKFLVIGMLGDWWVLYSSSSSISGFSIGSWFPVLPSDYW